ncbi:elongation factor P 5-aminopentanone reductase [Bacteroides finegoldii]|uniref:elongation factor P 5-aminopentanone reductase n=1 Tax=Bacteroides finegoldii TaxID=338188 RepID=UPI00242AC9EF|nr:3-oxoacyl-ACP reductase FabG [Bacteroides finegoldii]
MTEKNVLITGASRGIGRSTAILFAQNGYHVFLNCNKSVEELKQVQEEIEKHHPKAVTLVPGNVGNPSDVRSIFREIYSHCDSLDVLINNAGIAHIGLLMDLTDEEWQQIIDTNLSSVFYCCREAVPKMVSKKSGRIINISSMWGTVGASCEAAYSASKSGIHGLTRALAKELAPSGIPVNAIACGVIDTVMNAQLDKTERQELAEEIPAGRFCSPEEIAEVIWQTVNTPAYMTGQIIGVDGGYI